MKFRKKPVVIEAFQLTFGRMQSNVDWPQWLHEAWNKEETSPGSFYRQVTGWHSVQFLINTLEGIHAVSENDWIIKGIAGELYPCKPEIFKATYEQVAE